MANPGFPATIFPSRIPGLRVRLGRMDWQRGVVFGIVGMTVVLFARSFWKRRSAARTQGGGGCGAGCGCSMAGVRSGAGVPGDELPALGGPPPQVTYRARKDGRRVVEVRNAPSSGRDGLPGGG